MENGRLREMIEEMMRKIAKCKAREMTEPLIQYDAKGNATSFSGKEAVDVFRAATLASAIGLLKVGITPTRGLTAKKALAMATQYTGQVYKRGEHDRARADLKVWIETMKSAIPTEVRGK